MKIENVKHYIFAELQPGDVFFYPSETCYCLKLDTVGACVNLANGITIAVRSHELVYPCPDAKLVFE